MIEVMMDLLEKPIELDEFKINTIVVENKKLFRDIIDYVLHNDVNKSGILISRGLHSFDIKKETEVVYDYFNFETSTSLLKKIYDDISETCNDNLYDELLKVKSSIADLFSKINIEYDYDFSYECDLSLQALLKTQGLKPNLENLSFIDNLIDYLSLCKKYKSSKLFILISIHSYCDDEEINNLYHDLILNGYTVINLESNSGFIVNKLENNIIIDEDYCLIS